jgi:hypothetical protein
MCNNWWPKSKQKNATNVVETFCALDAQQAANQEWRHSILIRWKSSNDDTDHKQDRGRTLKDLSIDFWFIRLNQFISKFSPEFPDLYTYVRTWYQYYTTRILIDQSHIRSDGWRASASFALVWGAPCLSSHPPPTRPKPWLGCWYQYQ